MNARIALTIYLKELLDTLRDKRTIIAMIGVPVVLYPVLFIVASQVAIIQQSKIEEAVSKVALLPSESALATEWIKSLPRVELATPDDPAAALAAGEIDAIVHVPETLEADLAENRSAAVKVSFDQTEGSSREAADRIEAALTETSRVLLNQRLAAEGLPETFARPVAVERENVAPPKKATGAIIGSVLPLLMVVMLGVGAFYPAIDLTAGEKERGTFETLLSTPASKLEIVTGKFLAVFTLSVLTGLLNLASMTATLAFQFSQMVGQLRGSGELGTVDFVRIAPEAIAAIVLVLIPLGFFISAVMLTIALFARSFKDAQNLVTPFFLAIIMPAMIGVVPDVDLSRATQFIPIANVALLFRDLLKGTATLDMVFVVFLCTAVYALLALVVAAWMFQREEVILSEEKGIPLTFKRDAFAPRSVPTPGLALGLFGVVMLLIFYAGSYAQTRNIHIGLAITQYALILAPVVGVLWFARIDLRSALNLRAPHPVGALGTVVFAIGWVVVSLQLAMWQSRILPLPEGFAVIEQMLYGGDEPVSIWLLFLVIAVSPAICEEVLFRGALLSSMRDRIPAWAVILAVGVLFGMFHLSIHRFVPTALSGIMLTYLAYRTGSIFPAMIAHFIVNGTLLLIGAGKVPSAVADFVKGLDGASGLPVWLFAGGILVAIAGICLVEFSARANPRVHAVDDAE